MDYNATTPVDPRVREAMLPFLGEEFGNPSSLHWEGRRARKALEEAREAVSGALACDAQEVVFTSGGTEGANLAIKGVVGRAFQANGGRPVHVVTSAVEHQAVLRTVEYLEKTGMVEATRIGVDRAGEIDLQGLQSSIRENTVLISLMFVNNEIGNIYPIEAAGRIARERGILFHTDAVQAVGKIPVDLHKLPVDLLSLSGHKFYGPKGVGALYVRKGIGLIPLIHGGAQEMEKRGGTENLPGIVGLAKAIVLAQQDLDHEVDRLGKLRNHLQNQLVTRVPGTRIYGHPEHRVCNTLKVSFEGITSEAILIALDREGIAVSSGSACASGAVDPSHVLLAMGVSSDVAKGAVRFSLGRGTTGGDIDCALEIVPKVVGGLRE